MKRITFAVLLVAVACSAAADPASWPRWRGPNGNGVSDETGWNPKGLEGGARVLWTANIGEGYSNVALSGGRLYATGSTDFTITEVSCLDAATGKVVWRQTLEGDTDFDDPEATPAIDGDRLYMAVRQGTVACLNAADGSVIWKTRFGMFGKVDIKTRSLGYGLTASPVVEGPLVLIGTNRGCVALDKMTGKLVWDTGVVLPCHVYATPVLSTVDGKRTAIFPGPVIVDVGTGKVILQFPYKGDEASELVSDAIVQGDLIRVPNVGTGGTVVDRTMSQVVWSNGSQSDGTATPVLVEGYLYGSSWDATRAQGSLDFRPAQREMWGFQCVDMKTGKAAWTSPLHYVSLMATAGNLIMLDMNGTLTIARATPAAFTPLCSADVFAGANKPRLFVTPPVLCDGRIYCRNYAGDLVCIDAR